MQRFQGRCSRQQAFRRRGRSGVTDGYGAADTNADAKAKGEALKAFEDASAALDASRQAMTDFEAEVASAGQDKAKAKAKANDDGEDAGKAAAKSAAIEKGTVKVVATRDRRRIGRAFPAGQAVTIPLKDLKEGQLEALRNDPVLAVSEG